MFNKSISPADFNQMSEGHFPGLLGIVVNQLEEGMMKAEMPVKKEYYAPNGFLHAGSIVTLADTVAGYSTTAHLPENASSFTTLELKSNFVWAIGEGVLECISSAEHLGRTTQVWRVIVRDKESQKKVAVFSCTQLVLY